MENVVGFTLNQSIQLLCKKLILIVFLTFLDTDFNNNRVNWFFSSTGMVIGSYFWGCLADTKGRKIVLIGALLMDGICGLISSIAQVYSLFLILRFLNGFA